MKNKFRIISFVILSLMLNLALSCKKEPVNETPTVKTEDATNITASSVKCNGKIISDGAASIISRGFCWSIDEYPTINNKKTSGGGDVGNFTDSITGLNYLTTYYIRAYAINSIGIGYGNQIKITTLALKPTVRLQSADAIAENSITCASYVISDGGSPVIARGVCWDTNENPTISINKTIDGSGTGSFISSITGLTFATKYYIRAYATNLIGTVYSDQVSVRTHAILPTINTSNINSITSNSASCGGNITNDGGARVTARGVCWSTNQNPTTSNNKTVNGTGVGEFTANLTGLLANTTYNVRAYATNSAGTAYGQQEVFTTGIQLSVASVTTNSASNITINGATLGGNVSSDGNATVTERGIVYTSSIWQSPTISDNKVPIGGGTGTFSVNISGLVSNTIYNVRAYAINSQGTAYGTQVSFRTLANTGNTITDIDGNVYNTVVIGSQTWMKENLKTTKYRNGDAIGTTTPTNKDITTESTPKYQWVYAGNEGFASIYGRLYTWYAATDSRGICPTGWHVPSDEEWTKLTTFLGGEDVAGGKLKETGTSHWRSPNTEATNSSGFTALPGGTRNYNGSFNSLTNLGFWWSSTGNGLDYSRFWYMSFNENTVHIGSYKQMTGLSVRCVKD